MEPFLGEIRMVGINFAPRDWALCDGALLSIEQNESLFSLLGTTYGGDGRTTFALPDLRGRVPIGMGTGPGLTNRSQGAKGGIEEVTLGEDQIPSVTGTINANAATGSSADPTGAYLAKHQDQLKAYGTTSDVTMALDSAIANGSGGQAHTNMQPFQVVHYIIALAGTFPPRT